MIPIDAFLRHPSCVPVQVAGLPAGRAMRRPLQDVYNADQSSVYSTKYKITMKEGAAVVKVGTVLQIGTKNYIVSLPPDSQPNGALVCICVESP